MGNLWKRGDRIPVSEPDLTGNERAYLLEAFDSGWIARGKFIQEFEEKFADWLGVNFAVSCCNGTVALHMALLALEVNRDNFVYVTPDSYYACEQSVKLCGARLSPSANCRNKIIVHNYGYVEDLDPEGAIEDCSEALGSKLYGKHVGTKGALSTFSFFPNKGITTGEGGMVCTNRKDLWIKLLHIRNQGMIEPYIHPFEGYNYRMTNLQAAIGCAQMERIDQFIDRKKKITKLYNNRLKYKHPQVIPNSDPVIWMNVFDVGNRHKFMQHMAKANVETRPGFNPRDNMVYLPSHPLLTNEQLEYICEVANDFKTS